MRTPATTERRAAQRLGRRLTVRFSDRAGDWASGFTADIGPGGMRLCAPMRALREGAPLMLKIELPGNGAIDAAATIVWTTLPPDREAHQIVAFGIRLTSAPEAWFRYCYAELLP